MDRHRASLARRRCSSATRSLRVVQDSGELAFPGDRHLADGQVERKDAAVAAAARHLPADADDPGVAGRHVAAQIAVVLVVVGRRHQHVDVAADDLGARISEQPFGSGIERLDVPALIDDDDPVDRRIDDRAQPFLGRLGVGDARLHLPLEIDGLAAKFVGVGALLCGFGRLTPDHPAKPSGPGRDHSQGDPLERHHRHANEGGSDGQDDKSKSAYVHRLDDQSSLTSRYRGVKRRRARAAPRLPGPVRHPRATCHEPSAPDTAPFSAPVRRHYRAARGPGRCAHAFPSR